MQEIFVQILHTKIILQQKKKQITVNFYYVPYKMTISLKLLHTYLTIQKLPSNPGPVHDASTVAPTGVSFHLTVNPL